VVERTSGFHYPALLSQVIDATWPISEGPKGLRAALERIASDSAQAIDDGFDFVVLSDRAACELLCCVLPCVLRHAVCD
jgi:hypothetical protein